METFSYALIWLGFFASIVLGLYFYLNARHKERMALIEKNANVTEIFKARDIRFPWLKLGMIIIGIGFGVFFSLTAISSMSIGLPNDVVVIGNMLLFGGIGLVIAYFIEKPKGK